MGRASVLISNVRIVRHFGFLGVKQEIESLLGDWGWRGHALSELVHRSLIRCYFTGNHPQYPPWQPKFSHDSIQICLTIAGVLKAWFVKPILDPDFYSNITEKTETDWKAAHGGKNVSDSIKEYLVTYVGEPLEQMLRYESKTFCVLWNYVSIFLKSFLRLVRLSEWQAFDWNSRYSLVGLHNSCPFKLRRLLARLPNINVVRKKNTKMWLLNQEDTKLA